jgi:hypothetical protein
MKTKTKNLLEAITLILWIPLIVYLSFISWYTIAQAHPYISDNNQNNIQTQIRKERLSICEQQYKKAHINKQYIYGQIPTVRCAAYKTLTYAFESNYWKSRMCKQQHNCFWIKGNGVDTPQWFLTFEDQTEWRNYFAKKYWKYHYKKKIPQFVHDWSMTDREAYINYMQQNYQTIYQEIEKLYITWFNQ